MSAIALFADFASFPPPPHRPARHEPVRHRRPRLGRIRRMLQELWVAPRERFIQPVLRRYPF